MQINEALRDLFSLAAKPLVIAIDGPAGSGKSTLAGEIARAFAGNYSIEVIHLDELYRGWENPLNDELFKKLLSLIAAQKSEKVSDLAIYDWSLESFAGSRQVKPAQLLIIEGVGSCNISIREKLTTSIWLDIDQQVGLTRVLARDGEAIRNEMVKWQEMESKYFAKDLTRESADFILSTQ